MTVLKPDDRVRYSASYLGGSDPAPARWRTYRGTVVSIYSRCAFHGLDHKTTLAVEVRWDHGCTTRESYWNVTSADTEVSTC